MTPLPSWNDTPTRQAIVDFVESSASNVPPEERIAVFDNDGALWCEKPMPIELGFILQRLAAMAEEDSSLRERQPWKTAYEKDYAWLGGVIEKHYAGDDSDVKVLMGGILQAFADQTVEEYASAAEAFLGDASHPTLGRLLRECGYLPMVELLRHLEQHGFSCCIASGGSRDFMRTITHDIYRIPPERVIGSSNGLRYRKASTAVRSSISPSRTSSTTARPSRCVSGARIGRRPIVAGGISNGDIPMIRHAGGPGRPALRLLVLHDDPEREFDYTRAAERALERARAEGWTVVSVKNDWATVFAGVES